MKPFALALLSVLALSCSTVDMERQARPLENSGGAGDAGSGEGRVRVALIDPGPPEIVVIEKPVYVPEGSDPPPRQDAPQGRAAVERSNQTGIRAPEDYSKAAMVYDYDRDWVYEVYTQPLRATDICLEPGEQVTEPPFISDSSRWLIGAGVSRENRYDIQHIYVKPVQQALEASLIINTDRRVYHLILKSFRDVHMPMVRWRYPRPDMPNSYISPLPDAQSGVEGGADQALPGGGAEDRITGPDPRYLSFNYRVTYGWFRKPRWLPTLVYDDGQKTYITFPLDISRGEQPAVFENRGDIINYRVYDNVIIIDKLIELITIRKEDRQITIEKKRG
jgi:type IV secretion system protein VirB9